MGVRLVVALAYSAAGEGPGEREGDPEESLSLSFLSEIPPEILPRFTERPTLTHPLRIARTINSIEHHIPII